MSKYIDASECDSGFEVHDVLDIRLAPCKDFSSFLPISAELQERVEEAPCQSCYKMECEGPF